MAKNTGNIIKGMGAGLAAGVMLGIAGAAMMKDNKKAKNKANKALCAVESFIDNVQEMFR